MFTGIVEAKGVLEAKSDGHLTISSPFVDAPEGGSVAVNGVCLTVRTNDKGLLVADLSPETSSVTTLGRLAVGSLVNLERPVTPTSLLGGHFVQGHVDGMAELTSLQSHGNSRVLQLRPPASCLAYIAERGSVAIDGVALTITGVSSEEFEVVLIPHTMTATTLGELAPGNLTNIEVDILAKYVEKLMSKRGAKYE